MLIYRWQVVAGSHIENDLEGNEAVYSQGTKFWSKNDLSKFNGPGAVKFELIEKKVVDDPRREVSLAPAAPESLPSSPAQVSGMETFNSMTVQELKKWAESEEVELGAAKSKEQILQAIEKYLKNSIGSPS